MDKTLSKLIHIIGLKPQVITNLDLLVVPNMDMILIKGKRKSILNISDMQEVDKQMKTEGIILGLYKKETKILANQLLINMKWKLLIST